ncbi:hypothetical protein M3Y94_00296200 [Aphelenchoides besseyi]|nr:hypothetical protein M3Y94_00296200 [Aphelenchoides besseyi]
MLHVPNSWPSDLLSHCDRVGMSRSALQAEDRETFIKSQIIACQKVLNKAEAPLKQKACSGIDCWNTQGKIGVSPVITWKFCNLLHKLIRDGHRRVPDDCARHISRLVQLGNFWQHLRASGYGHTDAMYCRLLTKRLQYHQKYSLVPGNLTLTDAQVSTLTSDVNNGYELAVDLLDQLDELMTFKTAVLNLVDSFRWTSMIPQCQCLLAPLILVILDTSVLYDVSVKVLFRLHSTLPADVLMGHRERFQQRSKEFYEAIGNLQYFRYLVSVPTLPANAPNFLQSSDLDSYETQHAFLRSENTGSDGTDSPPDSHSLQEDILIDLSVPETSTPLMSTENNEQANMMAKMDELRRALDNEMKAKDDILNEARTRIDQYEHRLIELKQESDQYKLQADESLVQLRHLKETANATEQQAEIQRQAEEKAAELERKYQKLKTAYDTFRAEHLQMLYELRDLRNFKAERASESDELKKLLNDEQNKLHRIEQQYVNDSLAAVCDSASKMIVQCAEDLQNSGTISYPIHLAESALKLAQSQFQKLNSKSSTNTVDVELTEASILFCHYLTDALVPCAAAAYTSSIEHYEPTLNKCKQLITHTTKYYETLKSLSWSDLNASKTQTINSDLLALQELMSALPTASSDINVDVVGAQLQEEMQRMDNAIKHAVERIKQIQEQAQKTSSGTRLAVNAKILDHCNALMSAVHLLVEKSRDLQNEIVDAGRGTASPNEFYKRNHQWTKGLLSAAQAVGVAALELMNSADKVVLNQGKFEYLIVAAQEISASVAQLFVSSRVKADRGSERLSLLGNASKKVNECTAAVVAAVKTGKQSLEEEELFDFTSLSLHDAKRAEMESQVKALELEAELGRERTRLAVMFFYRPFNC